MNRLTKYIAGKLISEAGFLLIVVGVLAFVAAFLFDVWSTEPNPTYLRVMATAGVAAVLGVALNALGDNMERKAAGR